MVGGTPKPFACNSEGCTMTFTTEDHLNVHQRKHEMVLNLGIKGTNLVADQTPTPTRFLRNCEEVGLFQDLQNVNPFEETFRKAVEGKIGTLSVHVLPEDDTLHTPHIFPHLPEENISLYSAKKIEKVTLTTEENITTTNGKILCESEKTATVLTLSSNQDSSDLLSTDNNHKEPPTIVISETNESTHITNSKQENNSIIKCNNFKEENLLSINDKKINKAKYRKYTGNIISINKKNTNAKSKLHELLLQNKRQNIENKTEKTNAPVIVLQSVPVPVVPIIQTVPIAKVPILPKTDLMNVSIEKPINKTIKSLKTKSKPIPIKVTTDPEGNKKQDLLARNRAAALRCRERKKIFIESLEQQLDVVHKEKLVLVKENTDLKKEIVHLKTLLLAHRECPITKAMNMGQSIPIGMPQIVEIPTETVNNDIKIENKNLECKNNAVVPVSDIKIVSVDASPKPNVLVWED